MKVELENMELLRKQHECRKFYKAIDIARKLSQGFLCVGMRMDH